MTTNATFRLRDTQPETQFRVIYGDEDVCSEINLMSVPIDDSVMAGTPGRAGNDYGFAFYKHSGDPQPVLAGVRTRLEITPSFVINNLHLPFADHSFIQDNKIVPRAVNDVIEIAVRFHVTPEVIGAEFRLDLDIEGTFNNIERPVLKTNVDAGQTDVITTFIKVFTGDTFIANGGKFYITPTTNIEISQLDIRLFPTSVQS